MIVSRTCYPLYVANRAVTAGDPLVVKNKHTGETAFRVSVADAGTIESAIAAADRAFDQTRRMSSHRRHSILTHVVQRVSERREELAQVICVEAGKTIRDARVEVGRALDTFRAAAEESTRIVGEYMPLDGSARSEGCEGIWRRFPIGPCAFITPFNFPLNLAAHKVAPALAVGCPLILKPASRTPVTALLLGEILGETDLPEGAFSILPCSPSMAEPLTTDERIKLLSFTGSPEVGWAMKARAGKKKVVLELGGNAACIVDEDADLTLAADRIVFGAFYQSGQSCISVQRIFVHERVYESFKALLVDRTVRLESGDPMKESTFLGPLISEEDAMRIETWVREAVADGAKLLCGGRRRGAVHEATLLENVKPGLNIQCAEAFGPVATLQSFRNYREALARANEGRFGLQAGVFTNNLDHAFLAFRELEVGAVVVNDVPSFRVDSMPYGGVKDSGLGREGVRFAMEEMSEIRLMALNKIGQV